MVLANTRRALVGATAVAALLGWLQLAPSFGFPVTAAAGMFDRIFGTTREAGPLGWALLLMLQAVCVAAYFVFIERRTHSPAAPFAFAVAAWLVAGAVVMPLVGVLQGAPAPGAVVGDPMQANFFMLSLGIGAAAAALVGWLLFGAVLAGGASLTVSPREATFAVGGAALAAAIALAVPTLTARADAGRTVEGRVAAIPAGRVFISVLELPQPAGAVLGPHQHIPGFVAGVFGIATMVIDGNPVDVGPGDALFTADQLRHDHENRAAVPFAVALALTITGLAVVLGLHRGSAVAVIALLLVAGSVATVNPIMNHWYFIGVRPAAMRGAVMPVPAGHRTYESDDLSGVASAPFVERLTHRRLGAGDSLRVVGPAAIVVLDGRCSIVVGGRTTVLSAEAGVTISGGAEATAESVSGTSRILVVQLLPAS